jgi:hypothetical protein
MTQFNKLPVLISNEQLIKMAGQECFDKAQALLARARHANVLSQVVIEEEKASAQIEGFTTQLYYHGQQPGEQKLQGACSCPASEGFDFCEHCVCLCLYVNKQTQQIRSLAKGPDKSKILAYLLSLDKHELAKQCLHLITEDPNAFERYLWKAFLHQGDIDYSQLKSQITQLTRKPDNLFSQRQVKGFFQKMERFLSELVVDDAPEYDPEKMQKVVEYAFHRLNLLLEHLDDSAEHRQQSLTYLRQLYVAMFSQQICREDTQAKRHYQFWLTDRFDLLALPLGEILSDKACRKFKSLVETQWKTLKITAENQARSAELKSWQIIKLARYLFEEAIQSHDDQQAQYYRNFFSKDVNDD